MLFLHLDEHFSKEKSPFFFKREKKLKVNKLEASTNPLKLKELELVAVRPGILSVQPVWSLKWACTLFVCLFACLHNLNRSVACSPCAIIVPEPYLFTSSPARLGYNRGGTELDKHSLRHEVVDDRRSVSCERQQNNASEPPPRFIQAISCTLTSSNPFVSGGGSWLPSMEDSLPVLSPDRSRVTLRSAFSVCTSLPMLISPKSLMI